MQRGVCDRRRGGGRVCARAQRLGGRGLHQMTSPHGKLIAKKKAELLHAAYCTPMVCAMPGSSGDGPTSIERPKQMAAAMGMT